MFTFDLNFFKLDTVHHWKFSVSINSVVVINFVTNVNAIILDTATVTFNFFFKCALLICLQFENHTKMCRSTLNKQDQVRLNTGLIKHISLKDRFCILFFCLSVMMYQLSLCILRKVI